MRICSMGPHGILSSKTLYKREDIQIRDIQGDSYEIIPLSVPQIR